MHDRRRHRGAGRLVWPAAALPGLLLAALLGSTVLQVDDGRAPVVDLVVQPGDDGP